MDTEENNQSLQLDFRCSSSCTRAGLAVILFSALAFAILGPMQKAKQFDDFGKYVTLRLDLIDTLDQLEADPCWKAFISKEGNQVSSWNLSRLLEIKCESPPIAKSKVDKPSTQSESKEQKKSEKYSTNLKQDKIPPPAPTFLRVSFEIWQFSRIADIMTNLGDGKFLTLARSYSYRFNRSIYHWEVLRRRMLLDNSDVPVITGPPEKLSKEREDPSIPRERLIKYLTLANIRELSKYELPELREIDPLMKELSHFNLPSLGVPLGLSSVTYFIELGLLFSLAYFWLFQQEAKLSKNYPAPGTLFGVFTRTFISRTMFTVLTTLPIIASVLLAMGSSFYSYWNIVFAIFVVGFSIWIAWNSIHGTKQI